MKIKFLIILLLNLVLAINSYLCAMEYRGIVPFHSTREDVTRLLGKSPNENEIHANYKFEKEQVYIVYSSGLDAAYHQCINYLPHDTVMLVEVTPTVELKLSDLQIDQTKLRKFDPSDTPNTGYEGYIDDEEGIVIRTFEGKIDQIDYIAAKKDSDLCPSYYKNPEEGYECIGILLSVQNLFLNNPERKNVFISNELEIPIFLQSGSFPDYLLYITNKIDLKELIHFYPDSYFQLIAYTDRINREIRKWENFSQMEVEEVKDASHPRFERKKYFLNNELRNNFDRIIEEVRRLNHKLKIIS